ncbi:Uncharacterized protein GBIM_16831 [Gryllus bimaculatus]|nr:Uncharacterized protein GBIM_16831 [Gryllus bimaculatus]
MTTPTGPTAAAIASPGACRLLLLLAIVAAHGAWGVQITELHVPPVVRNGSSSAVLDCEYSLRSDELRTDSGLVVKWYFNNGPSPVYQWIAGGRPQDLGVLRGRLDLLYRASDNNAMKHRALYIVNPTTDLSGDYKCHVSTFADEDFMTKKMVVFGDNGAWERGAVSPRPPA